MEKSKPIPLSPETIDKLQTKNSDKGVAICQCPFPLNYGHIVEYNKPYKCEGCGTVFTLYKNFFI